MDEIRKHQSLGHHKILFDRGNHVVVTDVRRRGVPTLSLASTSAPLLISSSATSLLFTKAAISNGVFPVYEPWMRLVNMNYLRFFNYHVMEIVLTLFLASTSAPLLMNSSATSLSLFEAALCNGVSPSCKQ